MSDEIVSRLMKNRKKVQFLNESSSRIYEADDDEDSKEADEEYAALNAEDDMDNEEMDDTSMDDENIDDEDISDEDNIPPSPASRGRAPSFNPGGEGEEGEAGEEEVPEESEAPQPEETTEYENPLDNHYAVKFTLGDEISLMSTGTKNSDAKTGVIEGYDQEGFYKVKWSDESTTNGLTDIALTELVKTMHEDKCVCGCRKFITEGKLVVCDRCGRKIRESKEDPLMLSDRSRPRGKRMIRSEAHPVSTANKPSIAETICNALGVSIREDDDPDIDDDTFSRLRELDNEFWTKKEELVADIISLGYSVDEINDEYVIVSSEDDEYNAYKIPIIGTARTLTLDFNKAHTV